MNKMFKTENLTNKNYSIVLKLIIRIRNIDSPLKPKKNPLPDGQNPQLPTFSDLLKTRNRVFSH